MKNMQHGGIFLEQTTDIVIKYSFAFSLEAETQSSHNDKEPRVEQDASCKKKSEATFANEGGLKSLSDTQSIIIKQKQ